MFVFFKKKNKGFTLIELLTVIIVLIIIVSIAVPNIMKVVNNSKERSYQLLIESIENSAQLYVSKDRKTVTDYLKDNEGESYKVTLKDLVGDGLLKDKIINPRSNEVISLTKGVLVMYSDKGSLLYCYEDKECPLPCEPPLIAGDEGEGWNSEKGVNHPNLTKTGFTPVKWNGSEWEEIEPDDSSWYDYGEREWANAVSKDDNGDIIAYWVWIPRYVYKIPTDMHHVKCENGCSIEISFTKGIEDVAPDGVLQNTCEYDNDGVPTGEEACANDSNGQWSTHPAFTFGNKKLTGFWVAKFEPSLADVASCTGTDDGQHLDYKCPVNILPGVESWWSKRVGAYFSAFRNMETDGRYGWEIASGIGTNGIFSNDGNGVDVHLMKNVEWGAVAYLATSEYGQNKEIESDKENTGYITGGSGNYYAQKNLNYSTTGNVTGVYDMSGGACEYTAAYVNTTYSNDLTAYGQVVKEADKRYKDVYLVNEEDDAGQNYINAQYKKGDAIWETSSGGDTFSTNSWFKEFSSMPYSSDPWFRRGGSSFTGVFYFYSIYRVTDGYNSGRPAVLVAEGL